MHNRMNRIPQDNVPPPPRKRRTFSKYQTYLSLVTIVIVVVIFFVGLIFYKNSSIDNEELQYRRDVLRNMTREAWYAYRKYAWQYASLHPVSKTFHSGYKSGYTIVSAMSTLKLMGLRKEFDQGAHWVENSLNLTKFKVSVNLHVHETITDYIGGLLSLYALTFDVMYLNKAVEIGRLLEPAFETPTGLLLDVKLDQFEIYSNAKSKPIDLSYIGHQQPELIYLADATNNTALRNRLQKIKFFMTNIEKPKGLYLDQVDVITGNWSSSQSTLSGKANAFYYNLVRSKIQSGGWDIEALRLFERSMLAVVDIDMFQTSKTGLSFTSEYNVLWNVLGNTMSSTSCNLGALMALGAKKLEKTFGSIAERYWNLAVNLTETCHKAALKTETKLLPETFKFTKREEATNLEITKSSLSPELAESYFILWRLTNDHKYRDYAWQMVNAIQQHCRTEIGGYSALDDVDMLPASIGNLQIPRFFSGTLKYLYLIFSDDSILPLDQWVFNAAGHPLPICGKHRLYPDDVCLN